jgi:hypothetical protein
MHRRLRPPHARQLSLVCRDQCPQADGKLGAASSQRCEPSVILRRFAQRRDELVQQRLQALD